MAERQVSVGGKRYVLPELFMVMATQNPIEHEGTYNLPEAQLDRFLMYIKPAAPISNVGPIRGRMSQNSALKTCRQPGRKFITFI